MILMIMRWVSAIMGKRHNLPVINILTKKATINKNAPINYQGMDRFVAREQIIADLEKQNFLVKTEPHKLKVPRGEKSKVVIEPLLTDQWYVKTKPLAEPAIAAVQKGEIRFFPDTWNKTYFQWMENIEDWCIWKISRTGVSAANYGGGIAYPHGMIITGIFMLAIAKMMFVLNIP